MTSPTSGPDSDHAIGFEAHDHSKCVSTLMTRAEAECKAQGLRLTPVRRRALEILLAEHKALGAYDLLSKLAQEGHSAAPPVAYRALDFLTSAGFAHKIEGLNAYIACAHLGADHAPAFLICTSCKAVAEASTDTGAGRLAHAATATGFQIERTVIEALGLCPACQDSAPC